MYAAKRSGTSYATYRSDQDPYDPRRLTLISDLRQAVQNGDLELFYQPKVRLDSGEVIGVEALARWDHPLLGAIPPDQFIPLAEHTGLTQAMTVWALGRALAQGRAWRDLGISLGVAVNLSAHNLQDQNFPDTVRQLLNLHRLRPQHLTVEITETVIMTNPTLAIDVMTRLKNVGVKIAIDDFGTGYSSLAYLRHFPADELKIDRTFVFDMERIENNRFIVRSVIDLAHNLGLQVTAEGVETASVAQLLRDLGCDVIQGYYIERALPSPELLGWLRRRTAAAG
jgi:EAL domain-containing protein (putative c-di-GMP-specific phosphodiesterase class I)